MSTSSRAQDGKRKKLFHRFYEPLVLLYVLDRTQGDHISRQDPERLPSGEVSLEELQRRLLDSLSYVCDFDKGGGTITAIAVASGPLTYFVASNNNSVEDVVPFLHSLLAQLKELYDFDPQRLSEAESSILEYCVNFSEKRMKKYWRLLRESLTRCRKDLLEASVAHELDLVEAKLTAASENFPNLCMCCDSIRRSSDMNHIKQRAIVNEQHGNNQSPFAEVRHFIARLAFHVKTVRILVSAAQKLPALFVDPEVEVVSCQSISILPPGLRKKTTLKDIAHRMISNNEPLLLEIQTHLQVLDQKLGIERIVREEYAKKNFKPRVHAELILLEHFYRNRNSLDFVGNDPYISCSKPACYCCSLYIRSHPGHFIEPATHQKIYLNWMPPTSSWDVRDLDSEVVNHERDMLNKMVELIRVKTINQIKTYTKPRQKHYDSVTGDTFSAIGLGERLRSPQDHDLYSIADDPEAEYENENEGSDTTLRLAGLYSEISLDSTESRNESDDEGGVSLLD